MKLSELLTEYQILPDLQAIDCWGAVHELVDLLVSCGSLSMFSKGDALDGLLAREHQNGTGIGEGVAIPHAFIEGLKKPAVAFGRSLQGIEFECPDQVMTEFVILLIFPKKEQGGKHLKLLSEVARFFHACSIREDLRRAKDSKAILEVFCPID